MSDSCPKCGADQIGGRMSSFWAALDEEGSPQDLTRIVESEAELGPERVCFKCNHEWSLDDLDATPEKEEIPEDAISLMAEARDIASRLRDLDFIATFCTQKRPYLLAGVHLEKKRLNEELDFLDERLSKPFAGVTISATGRVRKKLNMIDDAEEGNS